MENQQSQADLLRAVAHQYSDVSQGTPVKFDEEDIEQDSPDKFKSFDSKDNVLMNSKRAGSHVSLELSERSLLPTKDNVFLTWHDVNFSVPNKLGKNEHQFVANDKEPTMIVYPDGKRTALVASH